MAIDYSTDIGKLRAIINDVDEENFEFTDDQLQVFLDLSYNNIILAAILALRALVAKYTATSGDAYRLDTIEYEEGKSKASNYLALLNNLEKSVEEGTNPLLVGVPKVFGVYVEDRKENIERMIDGEIIPPKTFDDEYNQINNKQQFGPYYRG